ncbi:uncharacterized protein DS421_11g323170 [Arachis hypogaea]|nr:uncharacterized protein DS421_11g323170 [Arachis hypogaea]
MEKAASISGVGFISISWDLTLAYWSFSPLKNLVVQSSCLCSLIIFNPHEHTEVQFTQSGMGLKLFKSSQRDFIFV